MTGGISIIVTGALLLLLPALMAWAAGVEDDSDFIAWIMEKPLSFLFSLQSIQKIGLGMMMVGSLMEYWPT